MSSMGKYRISARVGKKPEQRDQSGSISKRMGKSSLRYAQKGI